MKHQVQQINANNAIYSFRPGNGFVYTFFVTRSLNMTLGALGYIEGPSTFVFCDVLNSAYLFADNTGNPKEDAELYQSYVAEKIRSDNDSDIVTEMLSIILNMMPIYR